MKKLVVQDEHAMVAFTLQGHFKRCLKGLNSRYKNIYFIGDDNFICDYLMTGVHRCVSKFGVYKSAKYVLLDNESEYRKNTLAEQDIPTVSLEDFSNPNAGRSLIFFMIDTSDLKNKDVTLQALKRVNEIIAGKKNVKCVITVLLPEIRYYSSSEAGYSASFLNAYFRNVSEKTPETDYFTELHSLYCGFRDQNPSNYMLLRFDNVFAPDRFHTPSLPLQKIVSECEEAKKITITEEDERFFTTVTYVRDACHAVFKSAFGAIDGGEYNIGYKLVNLSLVKLCIFENYRDYFELSKELGADQSRRYNNLSKDVFKLLKTSSVITFKESIKYPVSYLTGYEFDISENIAFYGGKIKTIQALELEILKEIDRICRENDIKYFLAGGSLLGAVRSGGSIPWDDDLDIGMLRGDFEKFRKICEANLREKFEFSSPFNGSNSHYTIEKVRLRSTYFSTNYSSKNIFPDGVFVDLLVYDQTSNNKLLQRLQALILAVLYDCIIVRWYNEARRNFHYRLTKILLPVLRIFPWGFYHGLFEFFVKRFKNKKDAVWLIDSVGKKLKDGPLPKAGLEDTVYVDFDGIKAPIPVDCTGYLNYAYGPNYMEKPTLSNRRCPHNFARIDLGKYIFDVKGETPFREVNLSGELYEEEKEV